MEERATSLRSGRSAAKAIVGCLALSLIPAACALAALSSRVSSGPGWFAPNYDVEYTYVLNGLRFQQRLPIVFYIHPATTLADAVRGCHSDFSRCRTGWQFRRGRGRLVLSRSLYWSHSRLSGSAALFRVLRGGYSGVEADQESIGGRCASNGPDIAGRARRVRRDDLAETVVIVVGVLFAGTLTVFILDDCSSPRLCVALGVLGALGIATKVTFAIVTMAPAVLSRSRRQSILYFAVLIGCTGVLIAPILARIPQAIDFLAGLAYRTGITARRARFRMRAYLYGAGLLVRQNKIPAAVILLSVAVLVTLRSTTVLHGPQHSQLRALGVLTLLEFLQDEWSPVSRTCAT